MKGSEETSFIYIQFFHKMPARVLLGRSAAFKNGFRLEFTGNNLMCFKK